jgi:pyrroline-5-carboxylate reductase
MKTNNITFIGGGNMATSLISGLITDGYDAKRLTVSDPDSDKLSRLAARYGIHTTIDNHQAVSSADVVVLAVKPQILKGVATDLAPAIQKRQPLVISIVAGVQETALRRWLGEDVALVRSMPNTPAMIQAGATGLHAGKGVSKEQKSLAESILRAVGITCWVDQESLMDVVTAVSGSGPAYFFLVMEAIEEAARDMGLDEETARLLTLQTALGAARMAMESNDPPGILRSKVTSPGGTTEKALASLSQGNLRGLFREALTAARDRSEELSKLLGDQKKLNNG